ncbi:MAG: uracil-DNA glycosylase family protein [Pseudomonadota bacterium]
MSFSQAHHDFTFEPYVGEKFADQDFRILVLGESHYGEDEHQISTFTATTVRKHGIQRPKAFFRRITEACFGYGWDWIDPDRAWKRIAFANVVQQIVPNVSGSVTYDMLVDGAAKLPTQIEAVQPHFILALGNNVRRALRLMEGFGEHPDNERAGALSIIKDTPIVHSYHPSSRGRFKFQPVAELLGRLMWEAGRARDLADDAVETFAQSVLLDTPRSHLVINSGQARP